jgi:hypothetical protein
MVDYADPESRVPVEIVNLLKRQGIYGKPIGIYRICFTEAISDDVWQGAIPPPVDRVTEEAAPGTTVEVSRVDLDWQTLIERLTFGAYGRILDVHLPDEDSNFWQPSVVRDLGFLTADRAHRRFFHYLELLRHADEAAWDTRSVWARAKLDVRRDLAHSIAMVGREGATMSFGEAGHDVSLLDRFTDRLAALEIAIAAFEELLDTAPDVDESVYQDFLTKNPLLLDIYGQVIPKPNFIYPAGQSPLGKAYVQPDFLVRRPGERYRLVELERPSKPMATKKGPSRAEVSQAVFQIGEFKDYILEHYDVLKDRYPGINRACTTTVVISRAREESFGGRSNLRRQLQLLQQQHSGIDELITYDDLLAQAKAALSHLSGIASDAAVAT